MSGIPNLILVCAGYDRYLLINVTTVVGQSFLRTTIIENPRGLLVSRRWKTDGEEKMPVECQHRRISCEGRLEYYYNTMTQTSRYLTVSSWHEDIPVYTMTSPNLVLPIEFYKVFNGEDRARKWHFIGSDFPLASASSSLTASPAPITNRTAAPSLPSITVASAHIPAHIFKSFVESAILKKESCPITMDEITMENVGMTPCGHLFDKNALRTALNISKKCPQCRAPAMVSQIQT